MTDEEKYLKKVIVWLAIINGSVVRLGGTYHCGKSSAATAFGAILAEYERTRKA